MKFTLYQCMIIYPMYFHYFTIHLVFMLGMFTGSLVCEAWGQCCQWNLPDRLHWGRGWSKYCKIWSQNFLNILIHSVEGLFLTCTFPHKTLIFQYSQIQVKSLTFSFFYYLSFTFAARWWKFQMTYAITVKAVIHDRLFSFSLSSRPETIHVLTYLFWKWPIDLSVFQSMKNACHIHTTCSMVWNFWSCLAYNCYCFGIFF